MLDLLTNVKYLLKLEQVCIDNNVFRLHYKATAFLLAICSIIITSKQYIGDPIDCILDSSLDKEAINTYCWIFSTFTLGHRQHHNYHGGLHQLQPYPGVGNEQKDSEIIHQKYYQWVCFILAIQTAVFIFPHCLWRVWEGGRIKMLVADLGTPMTENWTAERKAQTITYLSNSDIYNLNLYALQFLFCEFLNVVNIVLQIFVWNQVFGNKFLTFGLDVINYASSSDADAIDPISVLFPKITKCNFHYYGPSGSLQQIDAVCVLPLNIVNEKMFLFLWFWFFSLAFLTIIAFLYDVCLFRQQCLRMYVLQAQARFVSRAHIRTIIRKGTLGHWFLLHQLGRNMNPFVFGDLLYEISKVLDRSNGRTKDLKDLSTAV
ncbi:hypothetical protein RUM44_008193 [Polyplax serrata]|uniref:Innexin n=1 Tax=Polyplax serrata TaxID=468196 RepID=A0ABR1B7U4_POLSC